MCKVTEVGKVNFIKIDYNWNSNNCIVLDSVLAKVLKDYHVCEYSHKVLNKTSEGIKWINSEIDKQFPGYEKKLHETIEPYSELFSDLSIFSYKILSNAKDSASVFCGNLMKKVTIFWCFFTFLNFEHF